MNSDSGATVHRRGPYKTQDRMQARYDAVARIVEDSKPTGSRFVYYRASSQGVVPKKDSGYQQIVRAVVHLRRAGIIEWNAIRDSSRLMWKPRSYGSLAGFLDESAGLYRRQLWENADEQVEVWVESKSAAGVVHAVTGRWDVPLYPISGQTSEAFAREAALQWDDRPVVVYYIGDHDPHGMEIQLGLLKKLRYHSGRDDIRMVRLACTPDQVSDMRLAGGKPKKNTYKDPITGAHVPWPGPAVEVEAIDAPILRDLVENAVLSHLDPDALSVEQEIEQSDRETLRQWAWELSVSS